MKNILKVGHSFNAGDLICLLPGLRQVFRTTQTRIKIYQRLGLKREEHTIKDADGDSVCMDYKMFLLLKPLIELMYYVDSFEVWEGQEVDWNLDQVRDSNAVPIPYSDIHWWNFFIYPEMQCDLSEPWISVSQKDVANNRIIINYTARYRNPYITYYFLKPYEKELLFVGTTEECDDFKAKWGLDIDYYECENFIDLCQMIGGARLFMGCQSMCWHLADGMAVPRLLEVCSQFPNTLPSTANGRAYLHQDIFEFLFKQVIEW